MSTEGASRPESERRQDHARVGRLLELELPSEAVALAAARQRVRADLGAAGVAEEALYAVDLVLEELIGNTIRYGYGDGEAGRIRVVLELGPRALTVTLIDDARPFDPTSRAAPAPPASLSEARIGGHGIAMVRGVARNWRYRRETGRNRSELELALGEPAPHRDVDQAGC